MIFIDDPDAYSKILAIEGLQTNTWSRQLNEEEINLYWCLLSGSSGNFNILTAGDFLIQFLPSTPEVFRITNQIELLFQK